MCLSPETINILYLPFSIGKDYYNYKMTTILSIQYTLNKNSHIIRNLSHNSERSQFLR